MTAFITRCSRSVAECARHALRLALFLALVPFAFADAEIRYAEIVPADEGYVVNADIDLELNSRLADAIARGVSLYFTAEFIVERPRWYWLNEVVAERELKFRVSYHAITRSYRLSVGSFHQSFDTLEEAQQAMLRIRNWHIVGADALQPRTSYNAALRMRLDTDQLPKPFQVTALGSRDWNLGTDWLRWTFLPGAAK